MLAVSLLVLGGLILGVSLAAAAAPTLVIGPASDPTYTTVDISGELDAQGEESYWNIQYSTDGTNWNYSNLGGQSSGTGPEQIPPGGGTIEGLSAGTTYTARVHVERYANGFEEFNSDPSAPFTTESVPAPTVTIDPVTTFTGTTARLMGRIEPNPAAGNPTASDVQWYFECSPECPGLEGGTVAAAAEDDDQIVTAEATELEPNTEYTVTLIGKNAGEPVSAGPMAFTTSTVAPEVETVPAFAIRGGTDALVAGRINPHNSATTYWIEYGPTAAYGNSAPPSKDGSAGSGGNWQVFSQKIAGLSPSSEYHFRVVAEGAAGPKVNGADRTFETAPVAVPEPVCPNATLRAEDRSTALPDCRAYEQVSPVDKNGFDASLNADQQQSASIAANDGSGIYFESTGAFGDAKASGLLNQYLSRRGTGGWGTAGLTPIQTVNRTGSPILQWFTPDLGFGVLMGGSQGHLAPGDNPSFSNLYLLDSDRGSYQTLNLGGASSVSHFFVGGTADGSRQFFEDAEALAPGAITGVNGSGGPLYNLYEWHEGQLKLASIIPGSGGGEEPAPEGAATEGTRAPVVFALQNLVSADGSRVVFNDAASGRLYLREDGERTLAVSAGAAAEFMGASADGSKIFFVSAGNLTPDASGAGGKLYCFEPETETLTNLIAGVLPGEPQSVGGPVDIGAPRGVVGVSEDGDYVYFRTASRFHVGDNPQGQTAFYLWHNGDVRYIAPDNGSSSIDNDKTQFRVSPDGRLLSFTSTARLTAYDNTDSVPAGGGLPRQDREVYVYDAKTDRVTCVSCNPSGQPPTGAPDGGPAGESSFPAPPSEQNANPQPGVRNDGSIFFNSRDALVPADVNGKMDVYEWKDGRVDLISSGTGGGDTFLASSSASGNDVFFTTYEPLLPSDKDDLADIYDARVGGGFPQPAEPKLCESIEGCHGAGNSRPPFGDPASDSFSAGMKRPNPRAERLRKALKACKHKKTRKAEAKCRAAVKKAYGQGSMQPDPKAERRRKALEACGQKKTRKAKVKCRKAAEKRYGKASNGRGH